MRIEDVPQDKKEFRDGDKAPKKVMYVTQGDGSYTQTESLGWEAENLVLEQAWEDIDERLAQEKQKVVQGLISPISYFMIKNRMDLPILASYVGKWQWQIKRHMKPSVFNSLSQKTIDKYKEVFNITEDELKNVK